METRGPDCASAAFSLSVSLIIRSRQWLLLKPCSNFVTLRAQKPESYDLAAKLIHTADLLLDACYASLALSPALARKRRTRLREVLQRIVEHARDVKADALLVAGGLFDAAWVTRETVAFARDLFAAAAPLPIYIAPGAADPLGPASPYAQPWPDNVTIFTRRDWQAVPVPGAPVVIHGLAATEPLAERLDFSRLVCPDDGKVHVALAHGRVLPLAGDTGGGVLRFEADAVQCQGLHYLALGGHHATLPVHGLGGATGYYPGAPEPHGFEETGPHFFLEVTAEEGRGRMPQLSVHPVASAMTQFGSYTLDCGTYFSMDQLLRGLRGLATDGMETLARVKLQGLVQPAVREGLNQLHEHAADAFELLQLSLPPAPPEQLDQLAKENTSMGIYVQRLLQAAGDAPSAQRRTQIMRSLEAGVAAYRGEVEPLPQVEELS